MPEFILGKNNINARCLGLLKSDFPLLFYEMPDENLNGGVLKFSLLKHPDNTWSFYYKEEILSEEDIEIIKVILSDCSSTL